MSFIIHNGEEKPNSIPYLHATNRAFKFGDALFESIRIINGKPVNIDNHIKRIIAGMQTFQITIPPSFTVDFFKNHLLFLANKNKVSTGGRARLTVYRDSNGFYLPENNNAGFVIEVEPYEHNKFMLNEKALSVDIYDEIKKPYTKISAFKSANAMLYIMAVLYAQKNNLDDALLINDKGNIIEATSSNVFLVSNGVLYTPPIQEGCIGGTMRMLIINTAIANGIKVYECNLTPQNCLAADEILLTNALKGIQWVGSYRSKRYFNDVAKRLTQLINDNVSN
jgi:branched-subunit amino acid aminotransferase/4-amino-4-deoxychorismate lyase